MMQRRWLELIKDYELEIHYHPGKANVIAYSLSRMHHCNNLMVQPLTSCCHLEELSLWVVPHGTLTNIALIPTIKEDVIAAQKMDAEWFISEEDYNWVHRNIFKKMPMEFYGSRIT
jgi:hypothetical protein